MKKFLCFCFSFILTLGMLCVVPFSFKASVTADEYKSLYSETNVPLFYGATKITIDKNVTENFSVKDSRFRIFAKDFEDGDLSHKIVCYFNNVQSTIAGNYELKYRVTDSHGNKSEIEVPVVVQDKEEGECIIQQSVYAIPSMANMQLVGTERCNTGDRQILGIFVPENQNFQIKMIEGDQNLQITFFTNTRAKNSFVSVNCKSTDYQTIQNTKGDTVPGAVPLVTSPRLESATEINRTFKIEVKYNSSVKALDYYHYKDSEEEFKSSWKQSENEYGVVDGEAILCVVPFADVDKLSGYIASGYNNPFESIDAFLEYYKEVVNRYDKMIGLEFDAKTALDQNYRTKYTAVADAAMAGIGAYYNGNFIAVCSSTISAIFQYGWGTLHEIAHGYQGTLGKGMFLNETGNNILAHYIQIDDSLYKKSDRYIGKLEDCEQSLNNSRYSKVSAGKTIFNNDSGTYTNTSEKLYSIVNMLDAFEGTVTYGKLFSFYRKLASEQNVSSLTVADVYAKFFAWKYNVNIVPYLKQWTMPVSESVEKEITDLGLCAVSITADALSDETFEKVKTGENLKLKYGLIREDVLQKYVGKCSLKINFEIDDLNAIKNKNLAVSYHGENKQVLKISSKNIELSNLEIGTYEIKVPTSFEHENKLCTITLKEGENVLEVKFEKPTLPDYKGHPTTITIFGVNGTVGYSLKFTDGYSKATPTLGAANLGNQNKTWEAKPDEVFASVTILDKDGNQIDKIEVKGKEYFTDKTVASSEYEMTVGCKIIVYSERADLVSVVSQITGKKMPEYAVTSAKTFEYEITKNGLKLLTAENFDEANVLYKNSRAKIIEIIEEYKNNVTTEEIENKRINANKKVQVIYAYNNLDAEDKKVYKSFIDKLIRGGLPIIFAEKENLTIFKGEELDLYSLIKITDNEDFEIASNQNNVSIVTEFDNMNVGTYTVLYSVSDSDGNKVLKTINVSVQEKSSDSTDNNFNNNQIKSAVMIIASVLGTLIIGTIIVLKVLKKRESK